MKKLEKIEVILAVREMMRSRYGFECDGGDWREINSRKKVYEFLPEKPTGQAAFFQSEVVVSVGYYTEVGEISLPTVEVSVSYEIFGGNNGNTISYGIITDAGIYDEESKERKIIDLIPMRDVRRLADLRMLQRQIDKKQKREIER